MFFLFSLVTIINAFILFCQCKSTIVNVIFSYMLVKTLSGDHFWHMVYVIQKYVKKKKQCSLVQCKPLVAITTGCTTVDYYRFQVRKLPQVIKNKNHGTCGRFELRSG